MAFKTEAFVLRSRDWQEADRLYDLFTPLEGVISAVLKSAAKPGNKLAGHLPPFAKVRVMIGRGKMDHLAGVSIIKSYRNIRSNLHNIFLASVVVELFLEQDHGGNKASEFVLLEDVLDFLDKPDLSAESKMLMVRTFLWKFLSISGWRPELEECLICRQPITEAGQYIPGRGIICRHHEQAGAILISATMQNFLRQVVSDQWPDPQKAMLAEGFNKEWLRLSKLFYQTVYDRPSQALKLFYYN